MGAPLAAIDFHAASVSRMTSSPDSNGDSHGMPLVMQSMKCWSGVLPPLTSSYTTRSFARFLTVSLPLRTKKPSLVPIMVMSSCQLVASPMIEMVPTAPFLNRMESAESMSTLQPRLSPMALTVSACSPVDHRMMSTKCDPVSLS